MEDNGGNWLQCDSCHKWSHLECHSLTVGSARDAQFSCHICEPKDQGVRGVNPGRLPCLCAQGMHCCRSRSPSSLTPATMSDSGFFQHIRDVEAKLKNDSKILRLQVIALEEQVLRVEGEILKMKTSAAGFNHPSKHHRRKPQRGSSMFKPTQHHQTYAPTAPTLVKISCKIFLGSLLGSCMIPACDLMCFWNQDPA